jgi:hypothetical protein
MLLYNVNNVRFTHNTLNVLKIRKKEQHVGKSSQEDHLTHYR